MMLVDFHLWRFLVLHVVVVLVFMAVAMATVNVGSDLGRFPAAQSHTIIGGSPTNGQEFPFFVLVNICGGSLVAPDVVMTAAHCEGVITDKVLVGAYTSVNASNQTDSQWRSVDNQTMIRHPNADILLFKIKDPVTLPNLQPISLNSNNSIPEAGQELTAIGYGVTEKGGFPNQLRKVTLNAVDFNTCNQLYGGTLNQKTKLCAAAPDKDTCFGDSGGPLFDSNLQLVGITSYGAGGCAVPEYPGIYARISENIHWIQETICALTSSNTTTLDFCAERNNNTTTTQCRPKLARCSSKSGSMPCCSPYVCRRKPKKNSVKKRRTKCYRTRSVKNATIF